MTASPSAFQWTPRPTTERTTLMFSPDYHALCQFQRTWHRSIHHYTQRYYFFRRTLEETNLFIDAVLHRPELKLYPRPNSDLTSPETCWFVHENGKVPHQSTRDNLKRRFAHYIGESIAELQRDLDLLEIPDDPQLRLRYNRQIRLICRHQRLDCVRPSHLVLCDQLGNPLVFAESPVAPVIIRSLEYQGRHPFDLPLISPPSDPPEPTASPAAPPVDPDTSSAPPKPTGSNIPKPPEGWKPKPLPPDLTRSAIYASMDIKDKASPIPPHLRVGYSELKRKAAMFTKRLSQILIWIRDDELRLELVGTTQKDQEKATKNLELNMRKRKFYIEFVSNLEAIKDSPTEEEIQELLKFLEHNRDLV